MNSFVGRTSELALLDQLWQSGKAELLVLYGRRRIGKTRLFTHWIARTQPRALYWVAEPTSSSDQLRAFSQVLFNFAHPQSPAPETFTYATWKQAFQEVIQLASASRLALFIDEFTYLLTAEPAIAGMLQNLWDHELCKADLFLGISGSHIGMMQRHLLSYQAPLYGRATATLLLQPLPFGASKPFFPHYTAEERVAIYAMMGGIPAYWERFDQTSSIDKNIRQQFLTANNLIQDEPRLLLQDFLNEPHNYVAILRALAASCRTPKDIANYSGVDEKHVPKYLSVLKDTGFVARIIPVTANETTRFGRHMIVDPFLRFYYRFLSRRQTQLALGVQDQALAEIKRHLLDFIGGTTWEELCQEWLIRAHAFDAIPFLPDRVGSAWTNKAQVDVAGINSMERTLILGECKWSPKPMGAKVLQDLFAKTGLLIASERKWQVYYLGFARGGWDAPAQQLAQSIRGTQGENWVVAGCKLLNLEDVDKNLHDWVA